MQKILMTVTKKPSISKANISVRRAFGRQKHVDSRQEKHQSFQSSTKFAGHKFTQGKQTKTFLEFSRGTFNQSCQ